MGKDGPVFVEQPIDLRRKRKKISKKKKPEVRDAKKATTTLTYAQFSERYGLQRGYDPVISGTINSYVERHNLKEQNWSDLTGPFGHILRYFGNGSPILLNLIYSNCDRSLKQKSEKIKGVGRRTVKGKELRKSDARDQNLIRDKYLAGLKTVIEYLQTRAPFLMPYPGDVRNPLSGTRLKELLAQLNAMESAELEIDELKAEDRGRHARYAYDPVTNRYIRVGTTVTDPMTVLLIYVWKAKEEHTGSGLSEQDYADIAFVMDFWKFFPKEIEDSPFDQVTLLRDRLKRYKKMNIRFHPSGWSREDHPMVYVE